MFLEISSISNSRFSVFPVVDRVFCQLQCRLAVFLRHSLVAGPCLQVPDQGRGRTMPAC